MADDYKQYGITVGQVYCAASDSQNVPKLRVVDVLKYADCDDVVVYDIIQGMERRIDCFKLAMVRYSLIDK